MKKITKYVLIAVGVCLIIFGALIPTMFKNDRKDTFTYERNSSAGYYYCYVYVTSEKDFEITEAVVVLQNAFNEHDKLTKSPQSLSGTNMFKTKEGDEYVYQITIHLTVDEFFDYTKVESVSLTTNIGQRVAEEETISFGINWRIPVMIVIFLFGGGLVIGGIVMIVTTKAHKSSAESARKEMARTNPEINTTNMTDEQVLSKYDEINSENKPSSLAELFGIERPKDKICEYCGSTNDADAKKCVSCGAGLKKKK